MEGGPFEAGFIPWLVVNDLELVSLFSDPTGIHSEQNFCPVLGICSPGTGINGYNGIPGIILMVQGDVYGKFLYFISKTIQKAGGLLFTLLVRFFLG